MLQLRAGEPVSAATSLRHGFVANGYVAEILCGNLDPTPLAIWHDSNLAAPETAHEYVEHCSGLWHHTPGAITFVRWLHTHPKVMIERAGILECQEALLWEHDPIRRRKILDREDAARIRIDNALSEEIVQSRVDRYGRQVAPWLHQATRRPHR